jgi:hypothetical protein
MLDVAMTTGHAKIKIAWANFANQQPFKDRTNKSTS